MPPEYKRLADTTEVDHVITNMATKIINDFEATPLFVSLLRGANQFTSKLMFEIARQAPTYHPEVDYMMVSTYGDGKHAGEPHIVTDLAPSTSVQDRDVVVLDDVLDKGITADFVRAHLRNRGAHAVKLAVLCEKQTQKLRDVSADYCGFQFPDKWLVGMGMDNAQEAKEAYRWLDGIWELNES